MPRCLIDEPDIRLVHDIVGESDVYTLEARDGCDALGVERWRAVVIPNTGVMRTVMNLLIRIAQRQEHK